MYAMGQIDVELVRKTKGSANEMINANDRLHFQVQAKLASKLRELGEEKGRAFIEEHAPWTPFSETRPCAILAVIHPPTNRRMDAPNWYPTIKPLIDGMTDAGVFTDDNNDILTSMTFIPGRKSKTKNYYIEIVFIEGQIFWK